LQPSHPVQDVCGSACKDDAGGEIDVLDASDFGPVTINKAVSIVSEGNLGAIQASAGTAITIDAGASDTIVLRWLSLDGLGTGLNGISFTVGGALYVESCKINNFTQYGIDFAPFSLPNGAKFFLTDTVVRNNGVGSTG